MASLVADYSDSDSEEDECSDTKEECQSSMEDRIKEEPKDESVESQPSILDSIVKEEPGASEDIKPSANFFSTTEDDDSDEDNTKTSIIEKSLVKKEDSERLPNPLRLPSLHEATSSSIDTSVFVNPFEEALKAKQKILEKHVQLSEPAPKIPAGKKICFSFKKGKCFRGKNCRFYHDPAFAPSPQESDSSEKTNHGGHPSRSAYHQSALASAQNSFIMDEPEDEDHYLSGNKRKKRHGVKDNLVPPKRAFENLQRQREKERPWTVGRVFGTGTSTGFYNSPDLHNGPHS